MCRGSGHITSCYASLQSLLFAIFFFIPIDVLLPHTVQSQDLERIKLAIDFIKQACLRGEDIEIVGKGDAGITLRKKGVAGEVDFSYKDIPGFAKDAKEETRASQNDKIRECMDRRVDKIIDALLGPQKGSELSRKTNLYLSIKESATDLAERAEVASIPGSIEAKNFIVEYNRLLQEAKDESPNEESIQALRELEYTGHYRETGKMVATAARKLARIADGLMAGGMETVQKAEDKKPKIPPATPPQLRSEGQKHQKTAQATPSKPTEVLDKTSRSEQMDIPQSKSLVADAKKIVDALHKEQYSDVAQHFTEEMRQAVPVGRLQMVWRDMVARNGSYKTITSVRQQKREYKQELLDVVIMTVEFERTRFDTEVSYNSNRQIAGLWFEPKTGKGYMCSVLSKATTMWGLAQGMDACPQAIKACSAYGATDCVEAFKGTYSVDQANTVTVHCLQNLRDFTGKGRQVIQEAFDFAVQSKWYGCVFHVKHF
jgi:hypothetical protein